MGDLRFNGAYADLVAAENRDALITRYSDETLVAALAVAAREDPYLANVLATEAMNRFRRKNVVLDSVADSVVALGGDGRVRFANRAAEHLLGWSANELFGRNFHETVDHRRIHSEDATELDADPLPESECTLLGVIATGEPVTERDHDVFTARDGRRFIADFRAAPVTHEEAPEEVVVVFRDATERRRREDRLRFFQAATDRAPVAVYWVERDGRIAYANRTAADMLGIERGRLGVMTVFDLNRTLDRERWAEHWERVRHRGSLSVETTHTKADGEDLQVRVLINYLDYAGRERHVTYVTPRSGPS